MPPRVKKSFPDLTGDGKVTRADVLKGRAVIDEEELTGRQAELDKFPGFSIASWVQRPESSGWVKVKTTDPFDKPIIQPNYLSSPKDQKTLVEGIKISRRLMYSQSMSKYFA